MSFLWRRNLAGKLLNERGQPERQCVVIRAQREEEVGHASAVLLDTKPGCFQGLGAWVLSQLAIQGYGCSIQGFGPLSLPYPGVRIRPVGLNQVGRVQDFY